MIEIKLECPGQAPRVHRFAATGITVGRAGDCELILEDPSLSRRHCRISVGLKGGYVVEDLGSVNGTLVAGRRIVGSVVVEAGVEISLGELRLEIVKRRGARGVVAPTMVRALRRVAETGERRREIGARPVGRVNRGVVARVSVGVAAVLLAVVGGWATAWAWDVPIVLPVMDGERCAVEDTRLLEADAVADAAAMERDVEVALRGGLRALALVRGTACAGRSRGEAAVKAALGRSESQRLGVHPAGVRAVVMGAEGRVLGLDEEGGVMAWERERPGVKLEVEGTAVAGKDGVVAVASSEGGVSVIDKDGSVQGVSGEPVVALGFAGVGRLVGVERGGRVLVWRVGDDGVWRATGEGRAWPGVTTLQIAGEKVLGFGAGRAAVWQIGRMSAPVMLRTGSAITAAAIDERGGQVVVGDAAGLVTRWALTRRPRSETLTAHIGAVQAVAWVGEAVASVGEDDALRLSELARRVRRDGPPLVLVAETPVPVDRLAVGGAGRWLLGGGRDGAVVRWDLEQRSRRLSATLHAGHAGAITALVAGEDWAVSGGADGVLRAWDLVDGTGARDETEADLVRAACRVLGWTEAGCEGSVRGRS